MDRNIKIYECAFCGDEIPENVPHETSGESLRFCGDCAFKKGLITESEYIKNYLFFIDVEKIRASVKDGFIHITTSKFPWEKTSRDRGCAEYTGWREAVFTRDNFTCAICGQVGGRLNAHHIKEYAKHPELRYDVDNGVTLCEKCHRNVHKRKV